MARKTEVGGDRIVDAVIEIIEEQGFGEVSARSIAAKLGVSTQPIYSEFGDMDGVRRAAVARGYEIFAKEMSGDALGQAVRYVKFATEHRRLFDFLFREQGYKYDGLDDLAHKLIPNIEIIEKLREITGLPVERTYRVHLCVWMALHGLAAMAADNELPLTDSDISEFAKDVTSSLAGYYKRKDGVQ